MSDDIPTSSNSVSNGEQNNQEYVHRERFFELLSPATSNQSIWLGVLGAAIFFGVWEIGNLITPEAGRKFLPSVEKVIGRLIYLYAEKGFIKDVLQSCLRIFGSFFIASAIAVPLGIANGVFWKIQSPCESDCIWMAVSSCRIFYSFAVGVVWSVRNRKNGGCCFWV